MLFSPPKVVQSGGKNIELAIMRRDQPLKVLAAPAAASAGIRGGGLGVGCKLWAGCCGLGTRCLVLSRLPADRPLSPWPPKAVLSCGVASTFW